MNNNEKQSFLKGKGATVATVICFVAVIAMVGAYTFYNYQNKLEKQLAEAEKQTEKLTNDDTEQTTTNDIILPEKQNDTSDMEDKSGDDQADNAGENEENPSAENAAPTGAVPELWFGEESILEWPASGSVIINYSMDQTVYFSTLEQYKYNPALVIGGEVGENIGAAAPGVVSNIEQDAQTGLTVTLDMGNGYSAVYGQLKEVPVAVGDYVSAGQIVGYLSEPTKYYSVEGPNLYFKILKDGEPVNPLDFMEG